MDMSGDQISLLSLAISVAAMIALVLTRGVESLRAIRCALQKLGDEVIKWVEGYCAFCERLREALRKLKGRNDSQVN